MQNSTILNDVQLTHLKLDFYNTLFWSINDIVEDTEYAFEHGILSLPDFARTAVRDQYDHLISIQNILKSAGINLQSDAYSQDYYSLHWMDIYSHLSEEAQIQWDERIAQILREGLPLAQEINERKSNEKR